MELRYFLLLAVLGTWIVALFLVLFPNLGSATPIFPSPPEYSYKVTLLIILACIVAPYSMYLGVKHIFEARLSG